MTKQEAVTRAREVSETASDAIYVLSFGNGKYAVMDGPAMMQSLVLFPRWRVIKFFVLGQERDHLQDIIA